MASAETSDARVSDARLLEEFIPETNTLIRADATTMVDPLRRLPSFIIAGPPRTGTSWLHEVLRHHTLLPSPTKETRFFDLHFSKGLSWYLRHFPESRDGRVAGEVAPTYFASAAARSRIASTIPRAKLVFIFRNPVQRLISLYRVKRAYGMFSWTLDEALERDPELIASSQYATHLREWQRLFPPEQISIHLFDELSAEPRAFIRELSDFLEVPRFEVRESQIRRVHLTAGMSEPRSYLATRAALAMGDWCKARGFDNVVSLVRNSRLFGLFIGGGAPFPEVSVDTQRRISVLLSKEIEEMETIVQRDLSSWKWSPSRLGD
ncbi:MAG TPA: sulfotransferase domain-containing protein [Acidobacteriaceae bacterium]|nr:sulfotransferase domain-containing protein [Acidobacteriaceae bacterium]